MAEEKKKEFHYGGQAVIEGVMMRGPKDFAVAVRRANGEIVQTAESVDTILGRFKWLDKPFLRGTLALIDAMALGMKALMYSADIAMKDAEEIDAGRKPQSADIAEVSQEDEVDSPPKKNRVNDVTIGATMVLGLVMGLVLFMLVPILITKPLNRFLDAGWQLTLVEGVVKIGIFLAYVSAISLLKDIRRVFQYHGAEHKVINAYEAKVPLTVENVQKYTKEHVRCGTSFILVVLVTSIVVFLLVADQLPYGSLDKSGIASYFARFGYKLVLLPFIAGLAYEVIRLAGKFKNSLFARMLVYPGLLMQKITTREPEPEMIEVAIRSLESVLEKESEDEVPEAQHTQA